MYDSCRYYVVTFKKDNFAVSIRQTEKLLRRNRIWGEARLAVEGTVYTLYDIHYMWLQYCNVINTVL